MAATGFLGPTLVKLGSTLIIVSVLLFVGIIVSIYAVTSYYEDWQRTLFEVDKSIFLVGLITAGTGVLVRLAQRKREK